MRTVAVVTVDRSDWGIYRPIVRRIRDHADLGLQLLVSGTHLDPRYGDTAQEIESDGFDIGARVPVSTEAAAPVDVATRMGEGTIGFGKIFSGQRPDLMVVLGDRFEMHAAALAALPFRIPVAHVHGGELTAGAMDDALRHSITKLAHLHFVSTDVYRRRVEQLGEEAWRITVSGAPSLDNVREIRISSVDQLERQVGMKLEPRPLLVTFHPETLASRTPLEQISELVAALDRLGRPVVFTGTNADPGGDEIARAIASYVAGHDDARIIQHLTTAGYFGMMQCAAAMVGNSSSGIIEAASFELPVVNIGGRQEGRVRGRNVVEARADRRDIHDVVQRAVSPGFREALRGMANPYGTGDASRQIVARLATEPLGNHLLRKVFVDRPEEV